MYLHIGNNKTIRLRSIIGIFDADTSTQSTVTKKFLSAAQKNGTLNMASEELPKSFVMYKEKNRIEICFSQLSVSTLEKRIEQQKN